MSDEQDHTSAEQTPGGTGRPRSPVIDAIADLMQTAVDWLRQEAEATVREKVVPPLQQVGIMIGAAIGASSAMVIGIIFVAVSLVMFVGGWIGYPFAFLAIGAAYLLVALVFTVVKVTKMQR
jgi:tetrahydromethanopterin S-methyltransferase subunit G